VKRVAAEDLACALALADGAGRGPNLGLELRGRAGRAADGGDAQRRDGRGAVGMAVADKGAGYVAAAVAVGGVAVAVYGVAVAIGSVAVAVRDGCRATLGRVANCPLTHSNCPPVT
jgi:hypothetical protein